MLKNYFKVALRNIIHQPAMSVIKIVSLAIAMTAVTMMAIWIQNELSFDGQSADANRIYLVKGDWQIDKNQVWKQENSFYPLADVIKTTVPEAEAVTRMIKLRKGELKVMVAENRFPSDESIRVDDNWFSFFSYQFVQGSPAVRSFGMESPVVGRRFNDGVIIGVTKDFFHQSLHEKIGPLVIRTGLPLARNFVIQAKPGKAKEAVQSAATVWKKFFPGEIFEYSFADQDFAELYKDDNKALRFTFLFSGLSILLCCMGLLGITIFIITSRTKEIGIRKILGATVAGITALLSKEVLQLVILSCLIACPIAWFAMDRWLQDYAYRTPLSWWVFAGAGISALLIAFGTLSVMTIKAALANPVKSLRAE
jgi:cell division protein FtsX